MIRIFLGKPGGGKTYGALRAELVDEAVNGTRRIGHNMELDVGKLSAYIQKHYPQADFDPLKRLFRLTDEHTKRFWMYRGPGLQVDPKTANDKIANGHFGNITEEMRGVLYIIDEAHIHFDARSWAENGSQLTYYNSQHRKFDDQVVFITQFADLLDKRVKGFAQEWWYFVNNAFVRVFSTFRLPKYFTCKTYSQQRTGAMNDAHCMRSMRYRLEPELAACYDTSAGVGIPGRKQVEKTRVGGLPIAWIIVPCVLAGAAFYWTPELLARGAIAATTPSAMKRNEPAPIVGPADVGTAQVSAANGPTPTGRVSSAAPNGTLPAVETGPVFVRSYALKRGEAIVTLTDGRTLTKGAGLARIDRDWVYDDQGNRYQVQRGGSAVAKRPAPTP